MIDKLVILNCLIFGFTVANFFALMLIYYFANRNWEELIDHTNQFNQLWRVITQKREQEND